MGVSTDAKLVWGFDPECEEGDELHDKLAALMDADYDKLTAAEKDHGGTLVYHCSDSCQMYLVGLKSTEKTAWRGHVVEIPPLDVPPDGQAKLDAFAQAIGVEPKPGRWLMVSWWG